MHFSDKSAKLYRLSYIQFRMILYFWKKKDIKSYLLSLKFSIYLLFLLSWFNLRGDSFCSIYNFELFSNLKVQRVVIPRAIPPYYQWKRFENHCYSGRLGIAMGSCLFIPYCYLFRNLPTSDFKIVEHEKVNKPLLAKSPIPASVRSKIRSYIYKIKLHNINANIISHSRFVKAAKGKAIP